MKINIIGKGKDLRTNTNVVYAQMSIDDYLALVGDDFNNFSIQRRREKHKAYARLKNDIIGGALLPAITLAVIPDTAESLIKYVDGNDDEMLEEFLAKPGTVNILDGLQRTYILKDLKDSGVVFKMDQKLHLEFWIEPSINNLIYRIIVLNAGQKPMSMRHQIEVLFKTFKDMLEREIPGLEIFVEVDSARRTKSRKYSFERVVTAYQSFLSKSPEAQKENIIAQKLVEEDILSESEEELTDKYNLFKKYLNVYADIDDSVCMIYDGSLGAGVLSGTNWFGSENVMNSFFAAISDFGSSPARYERIDKALERLKNVLAKSKVGEDPIGLKDLQKVQEGVNVRRHNVGFATRKHLSVCFREYFREEGDMPIKDIWVTEAE